MANCLNNCGNEAVGRSKYCGDSCKVLYNRKQKSVNTVNRKQPTVIPRLKPHIKPVTVTVLLEDKPANFGQPDCTCMHCQQSKANDSKLVINHGPVKIYDQLAANEINRVSLPGDVDYEGVCKPQGVQ